MTTPTARLSWDVFVAPSIPTASDETLPGGERRVFSPISATLIAGRHDAVLVDALMTIEQTDALGEWIGAARKNLTAIYATHGHGDHFFGIGQLQRRFPAARAFALPAVVDHMRREVGPERLDRVWRRRFPKQLPEDVVVAEPFTGRLELEGHELVPVPVGHTDTDDTTCLHVPSIGLVVAGDAAYNDVHLFLAESDAATRREWLSALDTIEGLRPVAVIAGHKRPGRPDDPAIIEETRQYIRDFDRLTGTTSTALELYEQVLAIYPDRVNPGAVWGSAIALKPAR